MAVEKRDKPIINTIGLVTHVGMVTHLSGWHLTTCLRRCACHNNPLTNSTSLLKTDNGQLGLHKYRACYCCEPWTAVELEAFVISLAEIERMPTIEEQPS